MNDLQWLKSFKEMWRSCRNSASSVELVASSDIDRLIKLAEKPRFDEIAKGRLKCDNNISNWIGCEHVNYTIDGGQYGENIVYCHDCREYIEL